MVKGLQLYLEWEGGRGRGHGEEKMIVVEVKLRKGGGEMR